MRVKKLLPLLLGTICVAGPIALGDAQEKKDKMTNPCAAKPETEMKEQKGKPANPCAAPKPAAKKAKATNPCAAKDPSKEPGGAK